MDGVGVGVGVGVVVVKDKNIMVTSTGMNRKSAGLIGIRFHDLSFFEKDLEEQALGARFLDPEVSMEYQKQCFCRAQVFGFLVLMTKNCCNTLRQVLGNKTCSQT